MKLFPDTSWTDIATAAVACMSVTGVWATFWPGHRERLRQHRQRRLAHLRRVNRQLVHIGNWGSIRYDGGSHNSQWYNPSWMVLYFDLAVVERFNQVVIAGDYRRELTVALVGLEQAAQRFLGMLTDQARYRATAPTNIGLRWPAVVQQAETKGSVLSPGELASISGLTVQDQRWLAELYEQNKAIHVEGIGGPGGRGLHESLRLATDALAAERTWLQTGRDSRWRFAGHIMAGMFAALGLLLLIDFGWSFVDERLHPSSSDSSTSADSTSKQVAPGTSHAAAQNNTLKPAPLDSAQVIAPRSSAPDTARTRP